MVEIIGKKIIRYSEIDSTSDEARRLIEKGLGEGTVVVAGAQTKGRGKPGFGWFSPPEAGVYLSVILKPYKNHQELVPITAVGAKAVVNLLKRLSGLSAEIKLPNDVVLKGKKICGILAERLVSGQLIIGLGLNVNNQPGSFPPDLKDTATSLKIETGSHYDRQKIEQLLIKELDNQYLAYLTQIC